MENNIELTYTPKLNEALLIVGLDGWGNALDVSKGMVEYMIRKLGAQPFGKINPDPFYSFDDQRPVVEVEDGILKTLDPPGGYFYTVSSALVGRDIIFLKGTEPNLRWFNFTDSVLSFCHATGVKTIISIGGMYDNVLHTDTIISAVASSKELLTKLKKKKALPINYKGPSSIHSTLHFEAKKQGFECLSLWCHCPFYLQGTTHFGHLSYLGKFLSEFGGFELDTEELSITWKDSCKQIQSVIDKNPELQDRINEIRKTKIKGSLDISKKHDKIIHLEDFLDPG
ncbi:MAG: PAC2 family protein [Deltaproteobacteria bacterium]|nr:PAC2 family protein [Deltaproteobacteria bacterium]